MVAIRHLAQKNLLIKNLKKEKIMKEKIFVIAALVGGFFIGKNWSKIKGKIMPYAEIVTQKILSGTDEVKKFFLKQKASVKSKPAGKKTTAKV